MNEERVRKAEALFTGGCNCAQAVFAAFADEFGMDEELAKRLATGLGGGVGRMREVCGAVSAAAMVIGMRLGPDKMKAYPVIQDFYSEEEKDAFHQKFVWYIAGGVGAILFGVVLLIGAFAFLPEREPYESLACAVFLLLIAGAVFSFIYGGMQEDKYKVWKYNRDNNPAPEAKRRLGLIGALCGGIMLTATAVYVSLGLTRNTWGTAWWLFAVGGILCGVVSVVLDPYKGEVE